MGCLKTQISQKYKKPNISRKTKQNKKNSFVKGSAGAYQTRVQNFRVYSMLSKTAWTSWTMKEFGVLCLNQPVFISLWHGRAEARGTV